jgi:hypothetical protein
MAGRPPAARARGSLLALRQPVTFGAADGLTVLVGLLISLAGDPHALLRAAVGAGVAELVGMSAGQYLSDEAAGPAPAIANGSASLTACLLPALPFLWLAGTAAIAASAALVAGVATLITITRPEHGLRAFAMTFGILALAAALCWAATLI